jgi:Ser/Thr protein kinase RdoA (MazF antagonist)
MATMIAELYDALKAAGAPEDQARKAAEVVAGYENRFARTEADLTLLKWMVGFNLAITIGVLTLLLRH